MNRVSFGAERNILTSKCIHNAHFIQLQTLHVPKPEETQYLSGLGDSNERTR
jgi:hypothetical protein